jgi:hypothetical protein
MQVRKKSSFKVFARVDVEFQVLLPFKHIGLLWGELGYAARHFALPGKAEIRRCTTHLTNYRT